MPRNRKHSEDEDGFEDSGESCPVCRQEFSHGVCPIRSADCPYLEKDEEDDDDFDEEEEEDDDDEDEDSDDEN